jgi:phenylpropionate dioxygenase-like ring-hydroxylating dioxygenase large terminal subunit
VLSKEENELLTRVGRGTPMGDLMRRYWLPACLVHEVGASDAPPVRIRLLGEDLVAFRDSFGRIGLLEEACAHRLASLYLGRNEDGGLRCVFHGWKYDVEGSCIDMPNEPTTTRYKYKVKQQAYPTIESGGIVWAYLGALEQRPAPPEMEWLRAPATHRFVSQTIEFCNYLQGIEGGLDTSHSSFLHNNDLRNKGHYKRIDTAPRLEVERTAYGFRYAGIRDVGEQGNYVRVYQFVAPFTQYRSHQIDYETGSGDRVKVPVLKGHMWVPVDDTNTMVYNWMFSADESAPLSPHYIRESETRAGRGEDGELRMRHRTRENDWRQDRSVQRTDTMTGIQGINTQDLAVQESMGPISDRTREHLTAADRAIILMRRILIDSVRAHVMSGTTPPGLDPATYRGIRATDVILPKGVPWQEAASEMLVARR